jgi:probable rRNA maturation factor
MSVTIDVVLESEDWSRILGAELIAHRAAAAALEDAGIGEGEVSVMLSGDAHIRELNKRFREKDQPTNVLSFPANSLTGEGARFFGDIALAYETLIREASAEGKSPEAHLTHLTVHGVLHLLGFDHGSERGAEKMENLETKILARLGFPDPYAVRAEAQSA